MEAVRMYRAIEYFDDNGIVYAKGDEYPKDGKADKKKVERFLSDNNSFERPIIEEIKDNEDVAEDVTNGGYDY